MSYDPTRVDWDFLVPLEIRDENLMADPMLLPPPVPSQGGHRPLITGFIALVKVFLCVGDIVSKAFPGPLPSYALSAGHLNSRFLPELASRSPPSHSFATPSLESLFKVIQRLHATLNHLPDELKLPSHRGLPPVSTLTSPPPAICSASPLTDYSRSPWVSTSTSQPGSPAAKISRQFEIMRVNIHVTSLYFQSALLEICLNTLQQRAGNEVSGSSASAPASPPSAATTASSQCSSVAREGCGLGADGAMESAARIQLWEFREKLASELLNLLTSSSHETLEANGSSMVS